MYHSKRSENENSVYGVVHLYDFTILFFFLCCLINTKEVVIKLEFIRIQS